jgi:glycosyltransferase involved in cell wall biosynthesis
MENELKIGFITAEDPYDKRTWSGTPYQMIRALERQGLSVIVLGPVKLNRFLNFVLKLIIYSRKKFAKIFYKKGYNHIHNHLLSYFHSKFFESKIKNKNIDVIFAAASTNQFAYLNTQIPICHYGDATVAILFDYYITFSGFSKSSIKESNEIEQRALDKAETQVFSCQWAYDSAVEHYNAKKPFIVKMGANIENDPTEMERTNFYESKFELLFIGVEWERKGGDIVLETLEKFDDSGYNVNLTVIGCVPPKKHPKMKVIPYINKNIKEEMLMFEEILASSHLFVLPTRSDCTPIVFCEANAYGLPVISTNTGGIPSIIEDGVNGILLPLSARGEEYYTVIESLILDREKLKYMSGKSIEKYTQELNWDQWGIRMKDILLQTYMSRKKEK